jgi:hypothetical protein
MLGNAATPADLRIGDSTPPERALRIMQSSLAVAQGELAEAAQAVDAVRADIKTLSRQLETIRKRVGRELKTAAAVAAHDSSAEVESMTEAQVAKLFSVTTKTLQRWDEANNGFPKPYRIGKKKFRNATAVRLWQRQQELSAA